MVSIIGAKSSDSPQRKEILSDIARRERLATFYLSRVESDRKNLDFARGSYVHVATLYDQIGDHTKADAARRAAANLGKGLRGYFPKQEKVFDLDTELAGIASAFAIAFGSFFLVPQLTGNVIGSSSTEMGYIGALLIFCGLSGLYGFAKRKKSKV
jgi:hypothetical protein